jgi:hypothetical protein
MEYFCAWRVYQSVWCWPRVDIRWYFFEANTCSEKKGTTIGFAVPGGKFSSYNELRKVNNSCFSWSVSSRKVWDTCSASPLCRSMAFSRVRDRRSCM